MKKFIFLFLTLLFAGSGFSQSTDELVLSSSVVCNMCKDTIEKGLAYTKGIKSTRVNVDDNQIVVRYSPGKISPDEIKQAIAGLGYVADEVKPTREAFDNLHECCKKPGVCED